MDRKIATIVGATAALVTAPLGAQAASSVETSPVPAASNYADLLEPIPDAANRLKMADAEAAKASLEKVQFSFEFGNPHHHHHHHHHSNDWYMRNGYQWYGGEWETPDYYAHHHHHHHHNHDYDDDYDRR